MLIVRIYQGEEFVAERTVWCPEDIAEFLHKNPPTNVRGGTAILVGVAGIVGQSPTIAQSGPGRDGPSWGMWHTNKGSRYRR